MVLRTCPSRALKVTADMAMHESWTSSWYATEAGKAYLALSRDEKRTELLRACASRSASRAGKKRKTAKKTQPSESDADSVDDPFSGSGYQMKVARVEAEHLDLVADHLIMQRHLLQRHLQRHLLQRHCFSQQILKLLHHHIVRRRSREAKLHVALTTQRTPSLTPSLVSRSPLAQGDHGRNELRKSDVLEG